MARGRVLGERNGQPGSAGAVVEGHSAIWITVGLAGGVGDARRLPGVIDVDWHGNVDRDLLDELTGANVTSPEEATEWQRQQDAARPSVTYIPAYESDGTTVIGEFPINRSSTTPP